MHVFTYGTLMFPEVWHDVVGRRYAFAQATARGYKVYRVRDAVFPGMVIAEEHDWVLGVVYFDVDEASLARLDRFEDNFYQRSAVRIDGDDGAQWTAESYLVPEDKQHVLTQEIWRAEEFLARGHLTDFLRRFAGFSRLGSES